MAAAQPAIPMEIVDDHNRALDFIYKLIARKIIPFNGLTLVHYDSHPDLAPPADLPIEQVLYPSSPPCLCYIPQIRASLIECIEQTSSIIS